MAKHSGGNAMSRPESGGGLSGGAIPPAPSLYEQESVPLEMFTIGRETEKAIGLKATTISTQGFGPGGSVDVLVWVPKSIIKEGNVPKWALDKKLREVSWEKNYGKDRPSFYNPKTGYNYDDTQMREITRIKSQDEVRAQKREAAFASGKAKHDALAAEAKSLGIKGNTQFMRTETLEQKIKAAKKANEMQ